MTQMEEAARKVTDFEKVTKAWDKLDANRERYHEIKHSGDLKRAKGISIVVLDMPLLDT